MAWYYGAGLVMMAVVLGAFATDATLAHGLNPLTSLERDPAGTLRDLLIGLVGGGVMLGTFVLFMVEAVVRGSGPYRLRFDGRRWRLERVR